MSTIYIEETDSTGSTKKTYMLTTTSSAGSDTKRTTRLDQVHLSNQRIKRGPTSLSSTQSFISTRIAPLFLPHGYPHTVTPDYTPYQIYDSLQAFASSIAHLLSSRAVLQTLGMDSEGSSANTATYATVISIARSTISNLSTILFADHMASRIAGEVKFYRFLADILNDSSFLLEMVSPNLPGSLKVPCLCLSSGLRAMTGVAAGSSKAILSAHFALDGNIGELNAKDGSQETLVNLLGMWVGGVVVSRVESLVATWCWMVVLLSLHLWFNWLAVTSVRLRGFNLNRAGTVLATLISEQRCETVENIGKQERIFDSLGVIRDFNGQILLRAQLGVSLTQLMRCMGSTKQAGSGSELLGSTTVFELFDCFASEKYLLWYSASDRQAVISLKEGATRDDQLKAWCHAIRVAYYIDETSEEKVQVLQMISETLSINNLTWSKMRQQIEEAGWDMTATVLEPTSGSRLRLSHSQ